MVWSIVLASEFMVYEVGMYEIARQVYAHCQERGELLRILLQRIAVLFKAALPVAQAEMEIVMQQVQETVLERMRLR